MAWLTPLFPRAHCAFLSEGRRRKRSRSLPAGSRLQSALLSPLGRTRQPPGPARQPRNCHPRIRTSRVQPPPGNRPPRHPDRPPHRTPLHLRRHQGPPPPRPLHRMTARHFAAFAHSVGARHRRACLDSHATPSKLRTNAPPLRRHPVAAIVSQIAGFRLSPTHITTNTASSRRSLLNG